MTGLVTLAAIGAITGFLFSMPVAGPVSVFITSQALKGKEHYAIRVAIGAVAADFVYCLIAVYGSAQLLGYFQQYMAYVLVVGAVLVVVVGYKISRTKIDVEELKAGVVNPDRVNLDDRPLLKTLKLRDKIRELRRRSGFAAGFTINIFNPTLLLTWLGASFIVISLAAATGLNVGSLNFLIDENKRMMEELDMEVSTNAYADSLLHNLQNNADVVADDADPRDRGSVFLAALGYTTALSIGAFLWLFIFIRLVVRYRAAFNIGILVKIIHGLGFVLIGLGVYLGYEAIVLLFK
ncbi:MAG: hypothetical protein GF419_00305 [Ignavibacteriales bacterium]|nr:hypothetical protein [Ignavibacteriales bacterium]